MKLSFVYITYRCGGLDILADALSNQTYKDFEIIIIDDFRPNRSNQVKEYFKSKGLEIAYIGPSKQKCFPELTFGIFNAVNTGFIKSSGDIVVVCTDYQWFESDCFEKIVSHKDKLNNKTCIVLPGIAWDCDKPRNISNIISIWDTHWKGSPQLNQCCKSFSWIPEGMEFALTAYPWNIIEEMNGFPEYLDAVSEQPLDPIMESFNLVGAKAYVDINNFMHMIIHRNWEPRELWYQSVRKATGPTELIKRANTFDLKKIHEERIKECQLL